MKIAVFGASGKTGQVFVRLAHEQGHKVTAAVRSPGLYESPEKVKVLKCDVSNEKEIAKVIGGQDAIVSFLGHGRNSPPLLQTNAMQEITAAMKRFNVSRIVSLTGTGVRFPGDLISFTDWFMNGVINLIDHKRIIDGKLHVKTLQESGLDWSVIRVLKLTDGIFQPNALTLHGPAKLLVSRETVSKTVLDLLNHKGFMQQSPIISSASKK